MEIPTVFAEATKYPILIAPHASLRKTARAVRPEDMALVGKMLPGMFRSMYEAPGVGLAAPQIDVDLRLVVIDVKPEKEFHPLAMINPEIIAASEEMAVREEGCLSLPGQYAEITRPAHIRVRFLDEQSTVQEMDAEGLLAACVQHEIDHLNGVLFVDHLSALKRNMLMRRLAKEQRRKEGS